MRKNLKCSLGFHDYKLYEHHRFTFRNPKREEIVKGFITYRYYYVCVECSKLRCEQPDDSNIKELSDCDG